MVLRKKGAHSSWSMASLTRVPAPDVSLHDGTADDKPVIEEQKQLNIRHAAKRTGIGSWLATDVSLSETTSANYDPMPILRDCTESCHEPQLS